VGHVRFMGYKINEHKILVWKPKGKRLQRILQHRWEDNIEVDLTQVEWGFMD